MTYKKADDTLHGVQEEREHTFTFYRLTVTEFGRWNLPNTPLERKYAPP